MEFSLAGSEHLPYNWALPPAMLDAFNGIITRQLPHRHLSFDFKSILSSDVFVLIAALNRSVVLLSVVLLIDADDGFTGVFASILILNN